MYATLPPHGRKRGDVEMYGSEASKTGPCGRFFTMTGQHLPGTPDTVGYRPDALLAIHREVFGDAPDLTATSDDPDRPIPALQIGDEEVLRLASTSPRNGEKFRRLWAGDSSAYAVDGNDGESEGDAALFETLAYYSGPDPDRIERLARRSERVREKWDRPDYLKRTIALVLRNKTRFYGDCIRPPQADEAHAGTGDGHRDCPEANRLRGLLLDRDDQIEQFRSCNATLSAKLTRVTELRALEHRMERDKQRIRRALKPLQAESIIGLVTVGPAMARAAAVKGAAHPFVTRAVVAAFIGKDEQTVGTNLKVIDLPGAPISRDTKSHGLKKLTAYDFAGMDTPDLLTASADWAEQLAAPPKLSPKRPVCPTCPVGTAQTAALVCDGCSRLLMKRRPASPNRMKNILLGERPPNPVFDVNYWNEKHPIADGDLTRPPGAEEVASSPEWLHRQPEREPWPEPDPATIAGSALPLAPQSQSAYELAAVAGGAE